MIEYFISQKNTAPNQNRNLLLNLVATLTINGMFFLIVLIDAAAWFYQEIYFSILEIPKVPRSRYIVMKRHTIPGLNLVQKWSCWYCEYANGVAAWLKAITNQTEVYSCAIKYSHTYPGQEYQANFYDQKQVQKKLLKK